MAIFTQSEVAELVGMPKSLLKNWTIGRPLKITPSERPARGKGSPNLYSRQDIYAIALAYELSKSGLALEHVSSVSKQVSNEILKNAPATVPDLRDVRWIVIEFDGEHLVVNVYNEQPLPGHPIQAIPDQIQMKIVLVRYTVNILTLTETIDSKIVRYERALQGIADEL